MVYVCGVSYLQHIAHIAHVTIIIITITIIICHCIPYYHLQPQLP